jgi:DNA-binding NarL/FixJ family response regulator
MSSKKTIYIVEDHPLFRFILVELINNEPNMTVTGEADNVIEALSSIKLIQPDAVIMDLTLIGSCGLELIKSLRAHQIQIPVLVLSSHDESLYAERVLRAGAQGYISKLASPVEVLKAINRVLAGQIYVSELINSEILSRLGNNNNTESLSKITKLSDREIEVFQLIGCGLNSRECAVSLKLGISTIDSYRARIKDKLGLKNAAELYQRSSQWLVENQL